MTKKITTDISATNILLTVEIDPGKSWQSWLLSTQEAKNLRASLDACIKSLDTAEEPRR